jgi:hypothetical protein
VTAAKKSGGIISIAGKPLLILFLVVTVCTCIDPYNPSIQGREALLVVDGLLTNQDRSYTVRLSRTTSMQNEDPVMVTGASVSINDQDGRTALLHESSDGIYKTDSLLFIAETGRSYTLKIKTEEGKEYVSDPCIMYPVSEIDSIYYIKDQDISNDNSAIYDGIRIFLDSGNPGGGKYFRWVYDEWWKFSVPNPKRYDYINQNNIPETDTLKETCYAHFGSDKILIRSTESSQTDRIDMEPILFVGSDQSDRLLKQYCIDISQLSLSLSEYQFWDQLREINEGGGDIFDIQPFSITGNVHCITDPSETVLGYFQVSAVEEKRIYILPKDLEGMDLPEYSYDCERVEIGPSDYPSSQNPSQRITFDKIYESYTTTGYIFIDPVYDMRLNLIKLAFARPACALCTKRGSLTKPYFWIDLDTAEMRR